MSTVNLILGIAATWNVPVKHSVILNAYVKADKEEHTEISLHVPACRLRKCNSRHLKRKVQSNRLRVKEQTIGAIRQKDI